MADDAVAEFSIEASTGGEVQGLATQSLANFDINKITPETHEVISRQATLNVGTIGHVAHGKSTVVRSISDVATQKFSNEAKRNITIHLGYANAKIFRTTDTDAPIRYISLQSHAADKQCCPTTGEPLELIRHVSFVDCPGHDSLMSTMLNGAAIMDAALLLVAANEKFPQAQTTEHLTAVDIMKLRHVLVLQNKIDVCDEASVNSQRESIANYLASNYSLTFPIIPISAQHKYNIDLVLEYICHIPFPTRALKVPALMTVVRSFDTNKPGGIKDLQGGVAGGSIMKGVLKRGQTIEIRPGQIRKEGGEFSWRPIVTTLSTLRAEGNSLEYAIPGGLIAVGTDLDPSLTRQDKLVGHLIGDEGTLPEVYCNLAIEYEMLNKTSAKPVKISLGDKLKISIGTLTTVTTVVQGPIRTKSSKPRIELSTDEKLACCTVGEMVTISKRSGDNDRLVGYGRILAGVPAPTFEL